MPAGGAAVELGQLGGHGHFELGPEHLGQQRVVAEPPPAAGRGRRRSRCRARGSSSRRCPSSPPVSASASPPVTAPPPRCAAGKPRHVAGLAASTSSREVVRDRAVVAREAPHEGLGLGRARQRDRGQAQADRPALGAPPQQGPQVGRQVDAVGRQQRLDLVLAEREVVRADVGDLARGTHALDGERRVAAAGEDEARRLRGVGDEELQVPERHGILDQVDVVEHDDELLGQLGQPVDERAHEAAVGAGRRGLQRAQRRVGGHAVAGGERRQQVPPQRAVAVVGGIDRQPRLGLGAGPQPGLEGDGLPPAGGCHDQRQRAPEAVVEAARDPGRATQNGPDSGGRSREAVSQSRSGSAAVSARGCTGWPVATSSTSRRYGGPAKRPPSGQPVDHRSSPHGMAVSQIRAKEARRRPSADPRLSGMARRRRRAAAPRPVRPPSALPGAAADATGPGRGGGVLPRAARPRAPARRGDPAACGAGRPVAAPRRAPAAACTPRPGRAGARARGPLRRARRGVPRRPRARAGRAPARPGRPRRRGPRRRRR